MFGKLKDMYFLFPYKSLHFFKYSNSNNNVLFNERDLTFGHFAIFDTLFSFLASILCHAHFIIYKAMWPYHAKSLFLCNGCLNGCMWEVVAECFIVGWLITVEALRHSLHPSSIWLDAVVNFRHVTLHNVFFKPTQIFLSLVLQEISLVLRRQQYHDMMELLESFDRMATNSMFRKYKPNVPLHGHAAQW